MKSSCVWARVRWSVGGVGGSDVVGLSCGFRCEEADGVRATTVDCTCRGVEQEQPRAKAGAWLRTDGRISRMRLTALKAEESCRSCSIEKLDNVARVQAPQFKMPSLFSVAPAQGCMGEGAT